MADAGNALRGAKWRGMRSGAQLNGRRGTRMILVAFLVLFGAGILVYGVAHGRPAAAEAQALSSPGAERR